MTHPLMSIRFEWVNDPVLTRLHVVRHWYHVPRMGDWIELLHQPIDSEPVHLSGTVKIVLWGEDHVTVRLHT